MSGEGPRAEATESPSPPPGQGRRENSGDHAAPRLDASSAANVPTLAGLTSAGVAAGLDLEVDLPRGAALGRYLVLERLGAGGMGVVYAAYDPELDRKVAVKLVRPRADAQSRTRVRARLLREAQALAKLSHPNVVTVHDVGTVGDQVFVAMEFIEGVSLRKWLDSERPPWRRVLDVLVEAGQGLAAAHAKGLLHRDFKPDNVMLERGGRVVVMDFGLARIEDGALPLPIEEAEQARAEDPAEILRDDTPLQVELTEAGRMIGTPAYMAPEQHMGAEVDARSDQFGFCASLYEALYGERPYPGNTLGELVMAVAAGHVRPEPRGTPVPRWVRTVVVRGLSPEADERWPSMEALLAALRRDPTRRRRAFAWIGGTMLLGAGGIGATLAMAELERERALETCAEEGRRIDAVWNAQSKEALQRALFSTGAPHAMESYERVLPWLDEWTARWSADRAAVCIQARVEETISEDAHGRALSCFEEQRERLAAMLEVYGAAEPAMVAGAVKSAAGLIQLESCADQRTLAQRSAPAQAESLKEPIAAIRRSLARAAALADAGEYGKGHEEARAALKSAEGLGWAPLVAETRMAAATIQAELGDYDEVVVELEQSFMSASTAGDDALAAKAAIGLLRVLGYHLVRGGEALAWARVAEALLAKLEREDGLDAAALANNVGLVHESRGNFDEALRWHHRALDLRTRALGEDHPECGHSYGNLGNNHLAKGEFEEALQAHGKALQLRTRGLGPNHPDTARSHNNLGRVHLAQGHVDEALRAFRRALEIFEPTLGSAHRVTARVLTSLGEAHAARGDLDAALDHLRRAHAIQIPLLGPEHPETAQTATFLGQVLARRGEETEALTWLRQALAARERTVGREHPSTLQLRDAIAGLCTAGHAEACSDD